MLQAVIFDMDGVLIDSEPYSVAANKAILPCFGLKPEVFDKGNFIGTSVKFYIDTINKTYGTKIEYAEYEKLKQQKYCELAHGKIKPSPGVVKLLNSLIKEGIRIAVASSGSKKKVAFNLAESGLSHYFKLVVTGEHVRDSKPNPEIYLLTARGLGLDPAECVAVEDSVHGVKSARAAGMGCLAVANSFPEKQLKEANLIVQSLNDVTPEMLRRIL